MLLDDHPPHFALIDGHDAAPDGLVGIMGCARPLAPRRFYAGPDALAVDLVAARHLGVRQPRDSSLLQSACHWFGGWRGVRAVLDLPSPVRAGVYVAAVALVGVLRPDVGKAFIYFQF